MSTFINLTKEGETYNNTWSGSTSGNPAIDELWQKLNSLVPKNKQQSTRINMKKTILSTLTLTLALTLSASGGLQPGTVKAQTRYQTRSQAARLAQSVRTRHRCALYSSP
jgi:hypothetical protein